MYSDPSWDIMPVANPELPEGKRRRIIRQRGWNRIPGLAGRTAGFAPERQVP